MALKKEFRSSGVQNWVSEQKIKSGIQLRFILQLLNSCNS
jgi:hypothetical protein